MRQLGNHLLAHRLKSYQLHSSLSLPSAPPFHSPAQPLLSPSASSRAPSRSVTRVFIVLPACPHLRFRTRSRSERLAYLPLWTLFHSSVGVKQTTQEADHPRKWPNHRLSLTENSARKFRTTTIKTLLKNVLDGNLAPFSLTSRTPPCLFPAPHLHFSLLSTPRPMEASRDGSHSALGNHTLLSTR